MARSRRFLLALAGAALLAPLLALAGPAATTPAVAGGQTTTTPTPYTMQTGVLFNDANGTAEAQDVIEAHIVDAIRHARRRSIIRVATWSFFSDAGVRALIDAHKRGVGVRLIMAKGRSEDQPRYYDRLQTALARGNKGRPEVLRSGVSTCRGACRGPRGTLHTKMFLFSHVGATRDVVMWGSPNLTSMARTGQWNDMFTKVGNHGLFTFANRIYDELWQGKDVAHPYQQHTAGKITFSVLPFQGKTDWVTRELKKVRCHGADPTVGTDTGRTRVQVAQAVIRGAVGDSIATELHDLQSRGCEVSVLYTVMGGSSRKLLGTVPRAHFVEDQNADGVFEKYLHMKVLAVGGHIGDDPAATLVMNGSENWSTMSRYNDEVMGTFQARWVYRHYSQWIDYLWQHIPPYNTTSAAPPETRRMAGSSRYPDLG